MALTMRQWRLAKEITQQQMADKLGVHVGTYLNWEEKPEKVSIGKAVEIAKILNVPMNEIIFRKEA